MSNTDSNYDAREQSELKHYALRRYLEAATLIIGTSRNLIYVDCCSGPWKACSPDCSDTSFGIAVHILEQAATTLAVRGISRAFTALLIEKSPSAFAQLSAFANQKNSSSLPVIAQNGDFTEKLSEIVRFCSPRGTFPFIFIDPTGWQLAGISRIRPLLQLNPGEVLINLMSPFIGRFIKDNKTDFSDLLGNDFPALRSLSGPELESAIVDKYCELIKQEGSFKYVCALPVMKPDMDSFNFHLIYATRHIKGVEVFKDVERRTEKETHIIRADLQQKDRQSKSGKLDLFGPEVLYKETCYQRLVRTNNTNAKKTVRALIEKKKNLSYDDCYGEALQFSAVYETHLRDWIADWEREGFLTVAGKAPTARVLSIRKNVTLALTSSKAS